MRTLPIQRNSSIGQTKEKTANCGGTRPNSQENRSFRSSRPACRFLAGLVFIAAVALHFVESQGTSMTQAGAQANRTAQLQKADIIDDIIDVIIGTLGGSKP